MKQLTYAQAVDGYLLDARAQRLSADTIRNYTLTYRRFGEWLGEELLLSDITPAQISAFLASRGGCPPAEGAVKKDDAQLSWRPGRAVVVGGA